MAGLWVLNFAHPLTESQRRTVEKLTGQRIERVLEFRCQFDHNRSFVEQAQRLLDGADLSSAEWQSLPILVNPPSLAPIACVVLAELHGRMGYFPPILRLRPSETTPPQYEVAEIINLQAIRDSARNKR